MLFYQETMDIVGIPKTGWLLAKLGHIGPQKSETEAAGPVCVCFVASLPEKNMEGILDIFMSLFPGHFQVTIMTVCRNSIYPSNETITS